MKKITEKVPSTVATQAKVRASVEQGATSQSERFEWDVALRHHDRQGAWQPADHSDRQPYHPRLSYRPTTRWQECADPPPRQPLPPTKSRRAVVPSISPAQRALSALTGEPLPQPKPAVTAVRRKRRPVTKRQYGHILSPEDYLFTI